MALTVTIHPHLELLRQSVHHRHAHAVETPRHLVAVLVELAARVQDRERDFDAGLLLGLVHVDRNAAAVVHHRDGVVGVNRDVDLRAVPGQRFVDRIVHHLVHQVVQSAPRDRADVHRRATPHGFQALQDLNRIRLVVAVALGLLGLGFLLCH